MALKTEAFVQITLQLSKKEREAVFSSTQSLDFC